MLRLLLEIADDLDESGRHRIAELVRRAYKQGGPPLIEK
jgi:hypothetical protein